MKIILLIGLSLLSLSVAAPPALNNYDQRQEGDLNVKVDLDNFVIIVAKTSKSSGLSLLGSIASLLPEGVKKKSKFYANVDDESPDDDLKYTEEEDEKDLNEEDKNLDDLSLDNNEKKTNETEAVILLVPSDDAQTTNKTEEVKQVVARTLRSLKLKEVGVEKSKSFLSSKYKFVDTVDEPQSLKLIGEAIENCGPGRTRDRFGICQSE